MINFTEADLAVIENALYTAIERYRECETIMANQPGTEYIRVAEQFGRQVKDCQDLLEKMEDMQ